MIKRTMMRPRDIIAFFNTCISQATNSPRITQETLRIAEGEYSLGRFRALGDEWIEDFPKLLDFLGLFKKSPSDFELNELTDERLGEWCLEFLDFDSSQSCFLVESSLQFFNGAMTGSVYRQIIAGVLYRIGFLGLKTESFNSITYAEPERRNIASSDISDDCVCRIHPMYWRALGVKPT
ncbi:hypothetical protein C5Y96_15995 [Blastopirellula marina]|uniref:Uncharacterized protein n=2 Tax=Pirellulales TaxID=2691354 RepID=A0A2S8FAR9_9BACT|nr:hypothetical protein C5Y96_15995 [Blastopirellula marina]RCS50440.1 hypothetical protein DTL36_16015 [Bremerella cremea]